MTREEHEKNGLLTMFERPPTNRGHRDYIIRNQYDLLRGIERGFEGLLNLTDKTSMRIIQ
jgi:hypothetical protein